MSDRKVVSSASHGPQHKSISGVSSIDLSQDWQMRAVASHSLHAQNRKRQRPCGLWRFPDDRIAQWIMHRPVLPVDEVAGCPASCNLPAPPGLRLQVAPYPAPFLLSRRPNPQVAPWFRAFGCAGDGPLELPRTSHAFGGAGFSECSRVAPVAPASSCSARDVGLGLPLVLHLRLYRRSDHRVAPMLASFGGADLPVLELPQVPALRYRRRFVVRVAPHFESSGTD